MSYLLDTNVVSEVRTAHREPRLVAWLEEVDTADLFISALVIGEGRRGIELLRRRGDNAQAGVLERWLVGLKADFGDRTLAVSSAIAERWGRLTAARPLPVVDGLMAATALEHDLVFVTRDVRGIGDTGVRLLDPWSPQ